MSNIVDREDMDFCATVSKHRTFIMGLMIISIVVFHLRLDLLICYPFNKLGHWGVDVFQFISGFGCVYAFKKNSNVIHFYRKRLSRLLPACIIVGATLIVLNYCIHNDLKWELAMLERLFSLDKWYIRLIIVSYLLFPLMYIFLKRYAFKGVGILIILSIFLGMFLPPLGIWSWYAIFFRVPAFVMGMYIALYNPSLDFLKLIACGCCFLIAVVLQQWSENYFVSLLPGLIWTIPLAMALPGVAYILCKTGEIISSRRVYQCIEIIGLYTLEVYLIHEFVIGEIWTTFNAMWLQLLVFLICVMCGAWVVKFNANKILAFKRE